MSEEYAGTIINVKRVTEAQNTKQKNDKEFVEDKLMFCIGENRDGSNELDKFIDVISQYKGKQVNLDFRIKDDEYQGRKYRASYLIVKEMVPSGTGKGFSKPKAGKTADDIRKKFGGTA